MMLGFNKNTQDLLKKWRLREKKKKSREKTK